MEMLPGQRKTAPTPVSMTFTPYQGKPGFPTVGGRIGTLIQGYAEKGVRKVLPRPLGDPQACARSLSGLWRSTSDQASVPHYTQTTGASKHTKHQLGGKMPVLKRLVRAPKGSPEFRGILQVLLLEGSAERFTQ